MSKAVKKADRSTARRNLNNLGPAIDRIDPIELFFLI